MSTSGLTNLLTINDHSGNREFFDPNSNANRRSGWISLTEGQHYYLEGRHIESSGGDHMALAVEIERDASVVGTSESHQHHLREVQKLEVTTDQIFEKSRVYVSGPM